MNIPIVEHDEPSEVRVHVDTDNEQWGRVDGYGFLVNVFESEPKYLVQLESTHERQCISVPSEDVSFL